MYPPQCRRTLTVGRGGRGRSGRLITGARATGADAKPGDGGIAVRADRLLRVLLQPSAVEIQARRGAGTRGGRGWRRGAAYLVTNNDRGNGQEAHAGQQGVVAPTVDKSKHVEHFSIHFSNEWRSARRAPITSGRKLASDRPDCSLRQVAKCAMNGSKSGFSLRAPAIKALPGRFATWPAAPPLLSGLDARPHPGAQPVVVGAEFGRQIQPCANSRRRSTRPGPPGCSLRRRAVRARLSLP